MSDETQNLWTISELAAEAAAVLSAADVNQESGRVSDVPSTRTIRYYTTHGLLDRPTDFRGRTALYDRRHLLQLVAIKRLQTRGTPLEDIQQLLIGASDAELESMAQIEPVEEREPVERPESPRRREAFWAESASEPEPSGESEIFTRPIETVPAARVAEGVTLLLDGAARDLHPDDLEAIRVAAEPLIKLLKSRRLIVGK